MAIQSFNFYQDTTEFLAMVTWSVGGHGKSKIPRSSRDPISWCWWNVAGLTASTIKLEKAGWFRGKTYGNHGAYQPYTN